MKTISEIVAHMIQAHNNGKNFDIEKLKVVISIIWELSLDFSFPARE